MFDITTLAATDTSTLELVGGDDAPLFDEKGIHRASVLIVGAMKSEGPALSNLLLRELDRILVWLPWIQPKHDRAEQGRGEVLCKPDLQFKQRLCVEPSPIDLGELADERENSNVREPHFSPQRFAWLIRRSSSTANSASPAARWLSGSEACRLG